MHRIVEDEEEGGGQQERAQPGGKADDDFIQNHMFVGVQKPAAGRFECRKTVL